MHVAIEVAPVALLDVPAIQDVHDNEPADEFVPEGQIIKLNEEGQKEPAGQRVRVILRMRLFDWSATYIFPDASTVNP